MREHSLLEGGRPSARLVLSIASGTLVVSSAVVLTVLAASDALQWQQFHTVFSNAIAQASEALRAGYDTAPALMLCLAVCAAVPFLGVAARLISLMRRDANATRRYRGQSGAGRERHAAFESDNGGVQFNQPKGSAFLEAANCNARFPLSGEMLRVGREDDNDVCLPVRGIHRYHAAVHRNDDEGWSVSDLSGRDGNGISVNGQRCLTAVLRDGDVIDIGPGRLRFRNGGGSSSTFAGGLSPHGQ